MPIVKHLSSYITCNLWLFNGILSTARSLIQHLIALVSFPPYQFHGHLYGTVENNEFKGTKRKTGCPQYGAAIRTELREYWLIAVLSRGQTFGDILVLFGNLCVKAATRIHRM